VINVLLPEPEGPAMTRGLKDLGTKNFFCFFISVFKSSCCCCDGEEEEELEELCHMEVRIDRESNIVLILDTIIGEEYKEVNIKSCLLEKEKILKKKDQSLGRGL
jgi:hypothetical protein